MESKGRDSKERPLASFAFSLSDGLQYLLANLYVHHPSSSTNIWENTMFISQLLQLVFSLAEAIISMLIVTDTIRINNYIYLIAVIAVGAVLTLIFFIGTFKWKMEPSFSHHHNNEVFMGFFTWLFVSIVFDIALSIWLFTKNDSGCCGYHHSQPDRGPFSDEYPQFVAIYSFGMIANTVAMYSTFRAMISHIYPESNFISRTAIANISDS